MNSQDLLTGLPTRSEFIKLISNFNEDAGKHGSWVVKIDIDLFIWVNDQFGWVIADQILIDIAKIIRLETQENNLLPFRVGGDDFIIVGFNIELKNLIQVMSRIQKTIFEYKFPYKCNDPSRDRVTVSVGICRLLGQYMQHPTEIWKLLDDLVFEEKSKNGKGYQAFYSPPQ